MKRKNYRVTIKFKFETSMLHSQTSARKAAEDVIRVYTDILNRDEKLKKVFENPPQVICKVTIENGRR